MNFMDITRLAGIIVFFNIVLIGMVALFYFRNRRYEKVTLDLEEFCADLPRDARLPDPCVLVNGKWIRPGPPPAPPAT
jgi:hypothetical protein